MDIECSTNSDFVLGANPYSLRLWFDHRAKEPVMHGLNFMWSLGAATAPLIISPFLTELPEQCVDNSSETYVYDRHVQYTAYNGYRTYLSQVDYKYMETGCNVTNSSHSHQSGVEMVQYGYITIGVLIIVLGLGFCVAFMLGDRTCSRMKDKDATQNETIKVKNSGLRAAVLVVMF